VSYAIHSADSKQNIKASVQWNEKNVFVFVQFQWSGSNPQVRVAGFSLHYVTDSLIPEPSSFGVEIAVEN
jgi:hypothetical protein